MANAEDQLRASSRGIVLPIAYVGALLGGVWFVAQQDSQVQALERRAYALEQRADDQHKAYAAIDVRMARIETSLQSIADSLRQERERPGGPR